MYLVEKFAAQDLDDAEQLVREVMVLVEGCQALALIHDTSDYIDAVRHAALTLIQNNQSDVQDLTR